MVTCICSIIENTNPSRTEEFLTKHGVVVDRAAERMLVVHQPALGHLAVPKYAQALSADLSCDVIAVSIQTTASCETVEHWRNGERIRCLSGSEGKFDLIEGTSQAWEPCYFFYKNAEDYIEDEEELVRFRAAIAENNPSKVLDLVYVGSMNGIAALLEAKGLSLEHPHATAIPKSKSLKWLWLGIGALVAAFIASALSGK